MPNLLSSGVVAAAMLLWPEPRRGGTAISGGQAPAAGRSTRARLGALLAIGAALALATACRRPAGSAPAAGSIVARPLHPAQGGPGSRFRRVTAAVSGLDFANVLRPENRYTYLTNGAGLAVGDYDRDGRLDVYLVAQDGPNKLFRQVAPLVFVDVTAAAGGVDGGAAWGTGATFADVDGDGWLDLYVCNMEAPNRLYLNRGDGTFREAAAEFGLDIVAASTMAAFADYDNDGRLDLYLLTNRALHVGWAQTPEVLDGFRPPADTVRTPRQMVPTLAAQAELDSLVRDGKVQSDADLPAALREHFLIFRGRRYPTGQQDRLLRNVGGRFVDVSQSAGIRGHGMGLSATWWDYDNDGFPDLYVANDLESPDRLYHNERNGTFREVAAAVLPHTAYYGMGADFGDVDGDGLLDFLVADMSMTTHEKAKVLMGDMDEERPVLIHARPPQYMRNALLLNTGRGVFQEAAFLAGVASTDWTWSVLFGDLDNDGRLDLFATNGIARFDTDPDLLLDVERLWREGRQQAAIERIQNVRSLPEANLALRNTGELRFEHTGADWGLGLVAISHGAALADFDGDGDLDVLVNNFGEPAVLYENLTTDGQAILVDLVGRRSNPFGVGARLYADLPDGRRLLREVQIARGYLSGQTVQQHFGLGAATAVAKLTVHWPSGHVQQFVDLAAGHHYTITEPSGPQPARAPRGEPPPPPLFTAAAAPPFVHRENSFDEYAAQPLLPAEVSRLGPGLAVGDADGDGRDDLFVGGASGQAGVLWLSTGDGYRRQPGPWEQDAAAEDLGCVWLDYDGDGDLDLFVASGGAEVPAGDPLLQDRLYRNEGGGRFVRDADALPDRRESSGHVAVGDFDGDGDLDLFVAGRLVPGHYPDAPPSRLYRNDRGRFVDVTDELAPALAGAGMVTSALFTDADGDGDLDLLIAAHWQPIRLLRNDGGRYVDATAAAGLDGHVGWWNSLVAWDIDSDGDLDYIAGNQGWNTKYKASPAHPARLFFGDFDGDGRRDLVEARYEGDRLLPVRGRSCSSQAMPVVAERFPTYERFARSLLADIYTPELLASCGQLAATTLGHCLLRNDGSGRFRVEPLPRRAQLAPLFGMVALGDLLVAAENSYAPEPETGRHDGGTGLVLRATRSGLEVVPPIAHGIAEFGDRKALVVVRAAGGADVVVARNDGPLSAHHCAGVALLAVPGSPGNPQAVGARCEFEFPDGRRAAAEVHGGSGYLSHTPAVAVPPGAVRAIVRPTAGPPLRVPLRRP